MAVLVNLEAEDAALVDGEAKKERSRGIPGGGIVVGRREGGKEAGSEVAVRNRGIGCGETRERVRRPGAGALAKGRLIAIAEFVRLPSGGGKK